MKRLIFAIACVMMLASCSTLRFSNAPENFSRKVPMTILPYQDDSEGGAAELIYQLQLHRYNLIAYETAKSTIGYDFRSRHSQGGTKINVYDNLYILDIMCKADKNDPSKYASYRATVSDLVSGKIILTATMRGKLNAEQVSRRLVSRMNSKIK